MNQFAELLREQIEQHNADAVAGRDPGRGEYEPMNIATAPGAGGNLQHSPSNDPDVIRKEKFAALTGTIETLGTAAGQGADVQVKYLLQMTQAAFEGVIDNTVDKHGIGVDDATYFAERYWKARNQQVIFDPKAPNQRKTISTMRQVITLGGWSKGGPGEPMGLVGRAMTKYKNLRATPTASKKLVDAANYLITIARTMKKRDELLDDDELTSLAFKPDPDVVTVEDVLHNMRKALVALKDGKHKAGVLTGTTNADAAIRALTKELKIIADAKRDDGGAGDDIAAEADRQTKQEVKDTAGVAAPMNAA